MLYIKPYTTSLKDRFPQFYEDCQKGKVIYVAYTKDELLGYIRCRKEGEGLFIEAVETQDIDIADGLVRVVFDAAIQIGSDTARFSEAVDPSLFEKLRLPVDEKRYINSLSDFLHKCRKCQMS